MNAALMMICTKIVITSSISPALMTTVPSQTKANVSAAEKDHWVRPHLQKVSEIFLNNFFRAVKKINEQNAIKKQITWKLAAIAHEEVRR